MIGEFTTKAFHRIRVAYVGSLSLTLFIPIYGMSLSPDGQFLAFLALVADTLGFLLFFFYSALAPIPVQTASDGVS